MVAPPTTQPQNGQQLAQLPASYADQERRRLMAESWTAYHGELADPLKVDKDQPNDNVKPNRCAPIVDKGVSFLFGQVLKIEAPDASGEGVPDDDEDGDSDPIQDYLDDCWGDDDDRMTLLSMLGTNGGVCGQVFVKIVPAQEEDGYPRLINLDPQLVTPVTAPDDCQLVLAYIIEYPTSNDYQWKQIVSRVDLHSVIGNPFEPPQLNPTWTITNFSRKATTSGAGAIAGHWEQIGASEDWPYPFPNIFTCQNLPNPNEFWGKPDLTPDLIRMNKVLNFLESNIARIIKYHGHPLTWAKGLHAEQIAMGPDDMLVLQADQAEIGKLDPMENFSGLLAVVEDIRSSMDEQSRVPAVALGRLTELPKGNISGVALALLFQPLIELTTAKRRLYGRLIRDVSKASLVISGKIDVTDFDDYPINLHWQGLLPNDDLAAAQTSLIYKQLGISDSTILQSLGFDPDEEMEKSADEDAKKMTLYSQGRGFPPMPMTPPTQQPGQPGQGESPFIGSQPQGGNQ